MGQLKSKHLEDNKTNSDEIGHGPYNTSIQRGSNEPRQLNTASEFNNREVDLGIQKTEEKLKKSEEEKAKLLEKIYELENENRSGISKTEHDGVKKARDDLQKVHMLLVEQHTQLVSKDKKQQAQLSDLENQLEKMSTQYRTLMDEINSFKNVAEAPNLAKKTAEDKLTTVNKDDVSHDLDVHWKDILKAKDQQIEKMKIDLDTAINEKEAIELSFQQLLNMTIDNAENSTAYLEQRVNEVHINCLNLRDELDNKDKQILELQKQSSSLEKLNKDGESPPLEQEKAIRNHFSYEIVKLQSLLEKCAEVKIAEKKTINKIKVQLEKAQTIQELKFNLEKNVSEDFSSQMSRLQALTEIGQDALKSVEDMVEKLKAGMPETKKSKENKKRRFTDMSEEETKALEQCLSPSSSEHKCECCVELERRCSEKPIEIRLSYWKEIYEKQLIVVVDTNIIIDSIEIIVELLACTMNGNSPVVYIPFIVTKELEAIKKDKTNRNPLLSRKCFESSKILEKEMRACTRIVEQSLASMKKCQIVNFKQKDADDYIVECCISLKKSNHNIVLWSQDRNLRLKVLGHHILSIRTEEIKEIIEHGTKNPLRALMLDNEIILVAMGMLKNVPQELILKMIHDPKNALMILMEKKEGLPTNIEPDESNNPGNRLPSAASLEDFNLVNLFED